MHDDDPEARPEAEPQAPRPSETLKGYRAAGWAAFGLALLCAMGIDRQLTPPRDPDWVTGALNFFALLAAQGVTSAAGVLFGLLEYTRPSHERDRWTGVVLWANVVLAFGVSALLILSRP
jgi:hypothetical protein